MKKEAIFLVAAAVGLTPIAMGYGVAPEKLLPLLYGIEVNDVSTKHIFRAVMGLYLAMVIFWLNGARQEALTVPALWSVTVFMLGLAAGRALSLLVDGMPHPLLAVYVLLELGFGSVAWILAKNYRVKI